MRAAARCLAVNPETLRLHVKAGLVQARPAPQDPAPVPPGRAERNRRDARAPLGMAARDVDGRVAASLGGAGFRQPRFEAARSVSCGGVLTAVPTLLESGLLDHAGQLPALRQTPSAPRRTAISVETAQAAGRLLARGLSVRAAARCLAVNPDPAPAVKAGLVRGPARSAGHAPSRPVAPSATGETHAPRCWPPATWTDASPPASAGPAEASLRSGPQRVLRRTC